MNLRLIRTGDENPEFPKASLWLRFGARLVDTLVAWLLYKVTGPAGIVMAFLYTLFADAMINGQSVGKKLFGVKAIYLPSRSGVRHRDSVLRNGPFGLVIILFMMPDFGILAFAFGALGIGSVEAWSAFRHPSGQRLGDLWAQTQVIDGKDVISQGEMLQAQTEARALGSSQPRVSAQTDFRKERES